MRALVTLIGLGYMGVSDFLKREFDPKPVTVLWLLAALPTLCEYSAVYLIAPDFTVFWAAAFSLLTASFFALYKLGFTEDGDVYGLAFLLFFNVASPLDPFCDTFFQLVLMLTTASVLLYPLAWGRRKISVREFLKKPLNYIYVRGIPELDEKKKSAKLPCGSFSLDVAVPALKKMVEEGKLTGSEEVLVEKGTPLLFYLFISYILSIILRVALRCAGI